ncbi:MAG: GNAT family N-acetyltransferase [Phocaeicola sp.]
MYSQSGITTSQAAKELWKICFEDDGAFTEFYFRCRYSDDIHMAIYNDKQMIAALQMIPYQLFWAGYSIATAYISGACTHPDFRKQKVMRKLLVDTHRRMYCDGVGVSTLIPAEPWLFNYYANSGYAALFNYQLKQTLATSLAGHSSINVMRVERLSTTQRLFVNNSMKHRRCSLLHSEKDLSEIVEAFLMDEGSVWTATCGDEVCGIAFVIKYNGSVIIKELLSEASETITKCDVENTLSLAVCNHYKVAELTCYAPVEEKNVVSTDKENQVSKQEFMRLGMARIIDVPKVLQTLAYIYPEKEYYFHLTDDNDLPTNNGYYTLRNGVCEKLQVANAIYEAHTIPSLTARVFASEHPYMSLMLD